MQHHALRTRQAASRRFVSVHVLVPGFWTVDAGHDLLEQLEADIRAVLPEVTITTHLEPLDDPTSHQDKELDRP
jgi:divalent metal cation (Fe/Co/Zn/Cd) transporter